MVRYAIIEGGRVTNVVIADAAYAAENGWIEVAPEVGPGWTYDGENFVEPVPEPEPVPTIISDRQFFQQLAVLGLITEDEALDAVGPGILPASMLALIDMLPQDQRFSTKIILTGATAFERSHPLTPVLGGMYGLDSDALDNVWRQGALL